jgi:hypothetical protein
MAWCLVQHGDNFTFTFTVAIVILFRFNYEKLLNHASKNFKMYTTFWPERLKRRDHIADLLKFGRVILKQNSGTKSEKLRTRFSLFGIGFTGRHLPSRQWNFRFNKSEKFLENETLNADSLSGVIFFYMIRACESISCAPPCFWMWTLQIETFLLSRTGTNSSAAPCQTSSWTIEFQRHWPLPQSIRSTLHG